MGNKELVSVIIPTYNREKSIVQSVRSVLRQTYGNLECIVVDDASTDRTLEILSEINDARLRYVQLEQNVGAAKARNYGISVSKGEIIAFNDSDDCWEATKLEKQMYRLNEDVGMVYCKYDVCLGESLVRRIPDDKIPLEEKEGQIFYSLVEANKIGTPTMLIKKKCLKDVGIFDEKYKALEDYELALRIAKKYRVAFVDESLVKVYITKNSVNSFVENKREAILQMLELYIDEPFEKMFPLYKTYFNMIDNDELYDVGLKELLERCIKNRQMILLLYNELRSIALYRYRYTALMKLDTVLSRKESVQKIKKETAEKNIAIYGAGVVGEIIMKRFEENGILIKCFVDKSVKRRNEYTIYSLEEAPKDIDILIVSIHPRLYNRREVENYITARIVGIDIFMDEF